MALTKVKAGNIILTTPAASSNDVTPATTQYVTTALVNLTDSAPAALNTLNELAAALNDDANFSTTVTNSIAAKLPLAGGTLTGTLTGVGVVTNGARNIIQRANDDSSIAFANNASGTPSGHTWAMGLDYSASNSLAIAYASNGLPSLSGSAKVVIDTSGNVAIGSTADALNNMSGLFRILDSTGGDRTVAHFGAHNYGDTGKTFINIGTEYGDGTSRIGSFNDTGNKSVLVFDTHSASSGQFTERMRIQSDGAVVVNNSGGDAQIYLGGTGGSNRMYLARSGADSLLWNVSNGHLRFGNNNAEKMRIHTDGAVIIGGGSTNLNVLSGTPMLQIGAGTGHSSLQFYSATGSVGALYFGDATSGNDRYDGYLEYRHNSREMAFRAGGATVLTLRGNNAHGTGHNVDYGEHQHDVGEGVGVGEFYTQVAGSSFTDQFRINFDNPSWGGVTVDIRLNPNSSAGASVWVQYTIYSHVAHASANISAKDISGEGTGYINWVQESAGNLKCQLKTQYVTDDASARITYQMNHRGSQSIYLEEI